MKTTPEKLAYDREWRAANREWQKAYDQRLTPGQKAAHQKAKEERFNKFKNEFVGPMPRGRAFYGKSSHLKARQRAYIDANPDEFQGPPRSLRSTNAAVIPGVLNVSKAEKMILTETGDWLRL